MDNESNQYRTRITAVSDQGLTLKSGPIVRLMPWNECEEVNAAVADFNGHPMLVLALGINDGRTIIAGETEQIWASLTDALHRYLPGVAPVGAWGPVLLMRPGMLELYPLPVT